MNTLEQRQSTLINAMRFPLIVLVVYAHSVGYYPNLTISRSLDGWNIFHFVSEMISHHFGQMAVCWFFLLSGYFLFIKFPPNGFNMRWMAKKWKDRCESLLLPYLIWNLLAVFTIILKFYLFQTIGVEQSDTEMEAVRMGPWFWFVSGPADYPLWYLRSLIILVLLAPVIWLMASGLKLLFPILLGVLYISPLEVPIILMHAVFFFCIGAWLGIHKINILVIGKKTKIPAAILAFLLAVVATFRTGFDDHTLWRRLFYPFGMITFLNICDHLIDNTHRCERLSKLSAAVFFIYAAHEIYILGWTKGLFVRIFGEGLTGTWIRFLFVPVVVLAVCLGLFYLLNRFMPRTLAFICGGRTKSKTANT